MYSLSVHQQLGKVRACPPQPRLLLAPPLTAGLFQMVVVSDDVHEYALALKDTEDKIARCPSRVRVTSCCLPVSE